MVVVLPAPLAEQAHHLSTSDVEFDPVENIVGAVAHPQAADFDHSVADTICQSRPSELTELSNKEETLRPLNRLSGELRLGLS